MLGYLISKGLTSIGVVGTHVDVDEGPRVVIGQLATKSVYLVVATVHGHKDGIVDSGTDDFSPFQIGGNENHSTDTSAGRVGSDAASQVSSGCSGDGVVAEFEGLGRRYRDHPILERERRVYAVVLDIQGVEAELFAETSGFD